MLEPILGPQAEDQRKISPFKFNQNEWQSPTIALLYPLIVAVCLPILIGLLRPDILKGIHKFILYFVIFLPPFIIFRIFYDWTNNDLSLLGSFWKHLKPIPPGIVYDTDLKRASLPHMTLVLAIFNIIGYFCIPSHFVDKLVFLPSGDPSFPQIIASAFTSAFLHGSVSHLAGNMLFLWVFGSALEPRIGLKRFVLGYLSAIVCSNLIVTALLFTKYVISKSPEVFTSFHSLGASGAISGIMGIFVIRCFFARVSISFPLLFLPHVSIPLNVQAVVLIGIFFSFDISGSYKQYESELVRINYWAHVGGYLGGFLISYVMKLHREAAWEAARVKARRYSENVYRTKDATNLYRKILAEEPCNEEALEYFLKLHQFEEEKEKTYYIQLLHVLLKKNFPKAIELFTDHFPKYISELPGQILLQLGCHFFENADLNKARICLEMAASKTGPWQAKSMIQLAKTFEAIGNLDRAKSMFEEIIRKYPETHFSRTAEGKVSGIRVFD